MVRIEPEQISAKPSSKASRQDLNQQPLGSANFKRPGPPKRKRRKFLLFVLLFFITLAAILFGLAWLGIKQIPYLSDKLYELPQPLRIIEIDDDQVVEFKNGVTFEVSDEDNKAVSQITEEQLTHILRLSLAAEQDPIFAPNLQAVITPDYIELFGLMVKPVKTNITLQFLPFVNDSQEVDLKIINVKAGNLSAPKLIVDFISTALAQRISELRDAITKALTVESIELHEGQIILTGALK